MEGVMTEVQTKRNKEHRYMMKIIDSPGTENRELVFVGLQCEDTDYIFAKMILLEEQSKWGTTALPGWLS